MRAMTNAIREKIATYIKNNIDISDLIKDTVIKGENLSGARIRHITRIKEDLSRVNFSKCIIGDEDTITQICDCRLVESNFNETKFVGAVFFRRNNCQRSNFNGAHLQNLQYQQSDFRYSTFCEAVIRIGTSYGFKSVFSPDLFKDLGTMWGLDVRVKDESV